MNNTTLNTLFHPIRLRIVRALASRAMTSSELLSALHNVPQASLYRHIKTLHQAELITTVDETRVNGTLERTYGLLNPENLITDDQLRNATPDEHYSYFSVYLTMLLGDFSTYLINSSGDLRGDGVSYRTCQLQLSKKELKSFKQECAELIARYESGESSSSKTYNLSTILLPE